MDDQELEDLDLLDEDDDLLSQSLELSAKVALVNLMRGLGPRESLDLLFSYISDRPEDGGIGGDAYLILGRFEQQFPDFDVWVCSPEGSKEEHSKRHSALGHVKPGDVAKKLSEDEAFEGANAVWGAIHSLACAYTDDETAAKVAEYYIGSIDTTVQMVVHAIETSDEESS